MLPFAVFVFLQCAVCAVTAVSSFKPYPSFIDAEKPPFGLKDAAKPNFSDIKPDFGFGLPADTVSSKGKQSSSLESLKPEELSFLEWSNRECHNGLALVEYFTYQFMEGVKNSSNLRDAFQVQSFNAKDLSTVVYNVILRGHLSVGSPHSEVSAQVTSRAVIDNFCKVKEDTLLFVIPHFIGRYLFYRSALTMDNVGPRSQQLFKITKQRINSVLIPDSTAYVTAIGEAVIHFLKSLGLYDAYSTNMVSGWFANELYELPL